MTDNIKTAVENDVKELEINEIEKAKNGNNRTKSLKVKMDVYARQNSMNEIKETGEKSPGSGIDGEWYELTATEKKNTGLKPAYSRQPSLSPLVENKHSVVNVGEFKSTESGWSSVYGSDYKNGGVNGQQKWCLFVQLVSITLSLLTLGVVAWMFYKKEGPAVYSPKVVIGHSAQDSSSVTNDESLSASFKLDQIYFSEHKKIGWVASEPSRIKAVHDEPCFTLPVAGSYIVFSRFTFKLPPGDDTSVLTHMLVLKSTSDTGVETKVFRRQYVSVIEHKLKQDSELRKPSVFTQFFDVKAGDKICTYVSNPDLLYKSSIDNDVNIIKFEN